MKHQVPDPYEKPGSSIITVLYILTFKLLERTQRWKNKGKSFHRGWLWWPYSEGDGA
jgi:hypothetical protein